MYKNVEVKKHNIFNIVKKFLLLQIYSTEHLFSNQCFFGSGSCLSGHRKT